MTAATLGISAGFVFVVVLLLVLTMHTAYHWLVKAGMIMVALVFYLVTLYSLPGFFGWPAQQQLPKKFHLIHMQVDEPRNETDKGAVYLWVDSLLDDETRPRAYQLPYNKELHARVTEARARMDFGQALGGEIPENEGGGPGPEAALPRFYLMEKPRPPKKQAE